MARSNPVTIGSDPEFFVTNETELVPICGLIGGTKGNGKHLATNRGHGTYLEDGCAIELNPTSAHNSRTHWEIYGLLHHYIAEEVLAPKNLAFSHQSEVQFPEEILGRHPQASVIGCAEDWDAYNTDSIRQPPNIEEFDNWRFAGGHIHVGIKKWPESLPRHIFVQFMDFYLGLPWKRHDPQRIRRKFYGQAGLFRPKSYGVEYRSFSNNIFNNLAAPDYFHTTLERLSNRASLADSNDKILEDFIKAYNVIDWDLVKAAIGQDAGITKPQVIRLNTMGEEAQNFMDDMGFYLGRI